MKHLLATLVVCLISICLLAQSKPVFKLPFATSGHIKLEQLKKVKRLEFSDEFTRSNTSQYTFYSCVVTYIPTQGDPAEFSINHTVIEKNPNWLFMLSKLSAKSKVYIEEIKVAGDDGVVRNVGSVNFIID